MSILDNDKQQIKKILLSLNDTSLNRFHNSVNISFAQMLAYIDNTLRESNLAEEIKCLLDTYRLMAERFYIQFELSLLNKIEEQRDIRMHASRAIEKIEGIRELGSEEMKRTVEALSSAGNLADVTYTDLLKNFPALLQEALDKLKTEWQRLDTIATSSQALIQDKELLRAVEAVAKAAAYSVGIEKDRIVIVPGNDFALYFFSYLDNLAVLTVPIYSVKAPWEWSIFWHELAGYKVRQLKSKVTIKELKDKLQRNFDRYNREEKKQEWNQLLELITRNGEEGGETTGRRRNRFAKRYLSEVFSQPKLVLNDLGSFEHQFEQMLKNLKMKNRFQSYDEIKAQGWCVDWFEELFEDAFSVMAIGEPFLDFFKDILSRHMSADGRHPDIEKRLNVAKELLRLMDSEGKPKKPATIEESAAQQILKFISLLTLASHPLPEETEIEYGQIAFGNIARYDLPEAVGTEIGSSIQKWSNKFLSAKDRINDAKVEAENFIRMFSLEDLDFISIFDRETRSEPVPSYDSLLENAKDYEGLLDLSFYDRDFFTGLDVKNVERLTRLSGVLPAWERLFADVQSTTIVDSLMTHSGEVRFTINGTSYQTTTINWNRVFPIGDRYHILM